MESKYFKTDITKAAMSLGTLLGLYQSVKLLLFPLSMRFQILNPILLFVVLGVPVVAWKLIKNYRDKNAVAFFPFISAWLTTILMFFYATVLSSVVAYVYLRFFDNGTFFPSVADAMNNALSEIPADQMTAETTNRLDSMRNLIEEMRTLTPLQATKQLIVSHALIWSNLFSLVIGVITSRPKPFSHSKNN